VNLNKRVRIYTPKPRKTYHDVLSPSQAKEMEKFLTALCVGARECERIGVKPDVLAAMRA